MLPNYFVQSIGPIVFLEHILAYKPSLNEPHEQPVGKCPHPCRGIATVTYILSGEVEHLDSIGNHVRLSSGGAHWMKAGKGVVHDEAVSSECRLTHPDISIVQFWINLPSQYKSAEPDYFSLLPNEIPKQELENNAGWIKIISGGYGNMNAKVPCYSKEFIYHIHLKTGAKYLLETDNEFEYAAFLPASGAVINDRSFQSGEFIAFNSPGEIVEIINADETTIDIILFGGEPYKEPIVVDGTFVMNTPHEITQAYNDYYDGKYGQLHID